MYPPLWISCFNENPCRILRFGPPNRVAQVAIQPHQGPLSASSSAPDQRAKRTVAAAACTFFWQSHVGLGPLLVRILGTKSMVFPRKSGTKPKTPELLEISFSGVAHALPAASKFLFFFGGVVQNAPWQLPRAFFSPGGIVGGVFGEA